MKGIETWPKKAFGDHELASCCEVAFRGQFAPCLASNATIRIVSVIRNVGKNP